MLTSGLVKTPLLPPPDIGWDCYLRDLPRADIETDLPGRFPALRFLFTDSRKRARVNASDENLLPGNGKKARRKALPSQPPPRKRNNAQSPVNPSAAAMRAKYEHRSPARPPPKPPVKSPRSPKARSPPAGKKVKKPGEKTKKASPVAGKAVEDPLNSPHMGIFMGLLRSVDNKRCLAQAEARV